MPKTHCYSIYITGNQYIFSDLYKTVFRVPRCSIDWKQAFHVQLS